MWPIHLKPQPDELLSSWIVRLSHAHGYKTQTMCSILFGRNSAIWNRDIDRLAPQEVAEVLIRVTGVTVDQFEGTTLRGYEGILFEQHNPNGMNRWIVPLGIFHRSRKRPGLMFCPLCLREDAAPYFRRRWRLALSVVCTKHECNLHDVCPKCASPVEPHRVDMQSRTCLTHTGLSVNCWKCGFDFRDGADASVPDKSLVRIQQLLDGTVDRGYVDWAGNSSMHSLVFFEGLRALIVGVSSRQTQDRLTGPLKLVDWPRTGLEMASLPMRYRLFQLLATVLEDWPKNFIGLVHDHQLRYSDLKGDSEQRAFWYEDVIRRDAARGYAPIGQEEADAIADAVELRYGRYLGTKARELSGRDIDAHVADQRLHPVSDDVYEDLLTSIDHQIAGALDKMERACLIRDKIMFATARILGLNEAAIANLTLVQLQALAPNIAPLDFSDVARSADQVRAWVEWYWNSMRPQLNPRPDSCHVFTSIRTRRGYRHSAIGARFNKVVDVAMLRATIPSFNSLILKNIHASHKPLS